MAINLDFETYSEAGYVWDGRRWHGPPGSNKRGLRAVGAAAYAEHPSTEVLVACWSVDGAPVESWVPGMPPPASLLEAVRDGALVYAWNSFFEFLIWNHVCTRRYGWPVLPLEQTRDSMAESRAFGMPGKLEVASQVVGTEIKAAGKALLNRFSVPRTPTKNKPEKRNYLGADPERAQELYAYCAQDVRSEQAVGRAVPPLSPHELDVWKLDQWINATGVAVDLDAIADCRAVVAGVSARMTEELGRITGGAVTSSGQRDRILAFLQSRGYALPDLTADTVEGWLTLEGLDPWARRVLEIRRDLSSASVKKLDAMHRMVCRDGRIRGLFSYCGAERTGRWAGSGVQPHNLPRGSAEVMRCTECGAWQGPGAQCCICMGPLESRKWNFDASLQALESFRNRDADEAMRRWGNVLPVIGGSLRSLFVAAPGYDFVASDYRAIEAVVVAALAGEEWRLEVFRTHGKIYEQSASKITGIPFEEYLAHKKRTGEHHPTRQSIGKVAELASAYGGSIGAWKAFGADEHLTDDEIRANVKRWREESPMIRNMWYGLERAAVAALRSPGYRSTYREIVYVYDGHVLRCVLPSGRALVYHAPELQPDMTPWGDPTYRIYFWCYNTNPKFGSIGWVQMDTYGGKLTENVVQAVSRDILAHGLLNIARAGYRPVLHVHDEIVCEEPHGRGSVEELEALMGDLPPWARGWPVIAHGGWCGREYRKD